MSMEQEKYEAIIEAILFTMGESVEISKIAKALELSVEATREILARMIEHYNQSHHGIQILELDDSYQMCTRPQMYEYLIRVAKQPKKHVLTDVVLETLSIIAYKQPVTRIEIEKIRGVSCGHAINKLLEYALITEVGRLDVPGRPILFGTTEEFLRCFGVQSIEELPVLNPEKLEEFKQEAQEEIQVKLTV